METPDAIGISATKARRRLGSDRLETALLYFMVVADIMITCLLILSVPLGLVHFSH
jgi:hypothetical protein